MGWLINTLRYYWKPLVVFLVPVFLSPIATIYGTKEAKWTSVYLTMVVYWMSEALPLPVTCLIPIFAFPLLGISSTSTICSSYMNEANILLIGSISVGLAVQQSHLAKRIALKFILRFGQTDRSLLISIMAMTSLLSMWLSSIVGSTIMVSLIIVLTDQIDNELNGSQNMIIPKITITIFDKSKEVKSESVQIEEPPTYWEDSNDGHIAETESDKLEKDSDSEENLKISREKFKSFIYLVIVFASNIGGTIVNIGSPANMLSYSLINKFWTDRQLTFLTWIAFNIPIAVVCLIIGIIYIQFSCFGFSFNTTDNKQSKEMQLWKTRLSYYYQSLGTISVREGIVGSLFVFLVLLWTFRDPQFIPGWENYFKNLYDDQHIAILSATPVMLIAFLLFSIPQTLPMDLGSKKDSLNQQCTACLTWDYVTDRIPWEIVLIMGSSFALADASANIDLHMVIADKAAALEEIPIEVIVLILTSLTVLIATLSSNYISAAIILPFVKEITNGLNLSPLQVMLPVATCCSFSFLKTEILHVDRKLSTTETFLKRKDIVKGALILNIICLIVINVLATSLGNCLFQFDEFYNVTKQSYFMNKTVLRPSQ